MIMKQFGKYRIILVVIVLIGGFALYAADLQNQKCEPLAGAFMHGPSHILELSFPGSDVLMYNETEYQCECSEGKLIAVSNNERAEVELINESSIRFKGLVMTTKGARCADYVGSYVCDRGNECEVLWQQGSYWFSYFGNVYKCNCANAQLVAAVTDSLDMPLEKMTDESILFNDFRYLKYEQVVP
ncbi:hypothetical protein [Sanyastnella coralliicola]|uniref:hypothetical protein n=1 Tax=Sanyastnella coralliicola TaxID=3069118 RepID=UPI0027B92AB7|nr:hypothetical protein [Longitalea sp. SCSIO 12813]